MTVVGGAEVEIRAKDAGVQKDIEKLFGGFAGPAKEFEKIVDRVTGGLGSGFTSAGAKVAAGLGVIAVAAGAVKSALTFETVGLEVGKLQRFIGGTAEDASRLRFAAQQSGVGVDQLTRSLGFLSRNIESGKAEFQKYGIATVDAAGKTLPLNQVLLNIAQRFKELGPGAERNDLALKTLGRSGLELGILLGKGRQGIEDLEKATSKYGQVLSQDNVAAAAKAIQAQRQLSAAFQGLQIQIGAQVLPALTSLEKGATQALLVVIPAAAKIIGATVVPVFEGLAHVVNFGSDALAEHTTVAKVLAGVAATAIVPALSAWALAQARVAATGFVAFLTEGVAILADTAFALNLVTQANEGTALSFKLVNAATGVAYIGLGVLVAKVLSDNQKVAESTKAANQAIVDGAASPVDALDKLKAKQAELRGETVSSNFVTRNFAVAFGEQGQALDRARKQYADVTDRIKAMQDATKGADDAAAGLEEQFTKEGLTLDDLGTKTGFTKDQIEILATSMKIDLSKATADQTQALENQARRLGINSEAALKLADDNGILADFTKDATAKTSAFSDALAQTVGRKIASQQADLALESAQRALQNVQKDNADKQTAANKNVEQTIRSLTSATNARAAAEEALQAILHPTARTKEEADLGLSDARIGQERAALAVSDAEARLRGLREGDATGKVGTPEQIKQAELDLADARNGVVRAAERVTDAQAKLNALTPAGIRGSKEYRDATSRLADANQGVADAQGAVATAQAAAKAIADDTAGRAADLAGKTAAVASAAVAQANATFALTGSQSAAFGVLDTYNAYLRDTLSSLGQTPAAIDQILARLGILNDTYHIVAGSAASLKAAVGSDFGNLANQFGSPVGPVGQGFPSRAAGGYVPGALGAPQPILAHGGEFVLSRDMLAGRQRVPASASTSAPAVERHAHVHIEGGVDRSVAAQAEHGARIVSWMLGPSGRR